MPQIDIAVAPDLAALFDLPPCSDLSIPGPSPLTVTLPTGGSIKAFADISKGIPTDCSMTFSLMLQIAPFLAVSECLIKILKLLKPLIDVVKSLGPPPDPIKLPAAIEDFVKAAVDLVPCLLVPTPLNILPFIRDLLCLILRVLKCFLSEMKSIISVLEGLQIRLKLAQNAGNLELASVIQCAQGNANAQAQHVMGSLEPVGVLLDLAGTMFDIVGVPAIKLPAVGSQTDLASLNTLVQAVQEAVSVITIVADTLGGCEPS
ncbi:MAG: hypothetical protein WA431_11950 [Candidatus Cybelea sp.]